MGVDKTRRDKKRQGKNRKKEVLVGGAEIKVGLFKEGIRK